MAMTNPGKPTIRNRLWWEAEDADILTMPNNPMYIVVHHSADNLTGVTDAQYMKAEQAVHVNRGWGDIGYNFCIKPKYYGR